jgi:hypothetical protein
MPPKQGRWNAGDLFYFRCMDGWMAYQDGSRLLGKCIYLSVPLRWLVSVSVSGTRGRCLSASSRGCRRRRLARHASAAPVDRAGIGLPQMSCYDVAFGHSSVQTSVCVQGITKHTEIGTELLCGGRAEKEHCFADRTLTCSGARMQMR